MKITSPGSLFALCPSIVTNNLRCRLCAWEVEHLSDAVYVCMTVPEVPEGKDSGVLTGLEAHPRRKNSAAQWVVSLWPEYLVRAHPCWLWVGHFPELSRPDRLTCNMMMTLSLFFGSDGLEYVKVLGNLKTLNQGCLMCVLEKPGIPQEITEMASWLHIPSSIREDELLLEFCIQFNWKEKAVTLKIGKLWYFTNYYFHTFPLQNIPG